MIEKLPTPTALIFDFGGVLIKWDPYPVYRDHFNGDTRAIDQFMADIDFTSWNLEQDRGRAFSTAVAEHAARFPHYADLIRLYDEDWEKSIIGAIQPSVDILARLKQSGWTLYGLSNWSEEKFELVRPRFPFLEWFDQIVISGEVKLVKPDPRIFQVLLNRTGRTAEECLLIDDSLSNITAAQQLGFQTIHFRSADQLAAELQQRGILTLSAEGSLTSNV